MLVFLISTAPANASVNLTDVNSGWRYVSADAIDQTTGDVTITANTGYDAIAGPYTANVSVTLPAGIIFSDNGIDTKTFADVVLSESTPFYLYGDTDLKVDVGVDVSGSIIADVRVYVKDGGAYVLDETQSQVIAKVAGSSNDASLSSLVPNNGGLDPSFDSGIYEYTLNVENSVSSITLTPIVNDSNAAVTVNGVAVVNGTASEPFDLVEGIPQAIPVVVIAQDGVTTETYTVTATRAENVIPSGYVGVTCSYTWVDADVNQIAGEIHITQGVDYSAIAGEIDKVYMQITMPDGVLCSSYVSSAGTEESFNGNEILISNTDPNVELSNIVLDIDPGMTGAIIADVRIYGKNSSGQFIFDRTLSKTIARVNSTVLSISAATAESVAADLDQRGADLTIRETSPNVFSDPNDVTITILTAGVTWDIAASGFENFTATFCTADEVIVDTDKILNFNIVDDPDQISRVIFTPRFDVSPATTGDIVVRVSGTNIETADYTLAQVAASTDLILSDNSIEMDTDDEVIIRAYLPDGVTIDDIMDISWETDDGDIAEIVDYDVSNPGYVEFILNSYDEGSCTITISVTTTAGDFQGSCLVTVTGGATGTGYVDVNSAWCYVSADATDQTTGDLIITANPGYNAIAGPYTANVSVTLPEGVTFSDNSTNTKTFPDVGLSESTPVHLYGDTDDLVINVAADVIGSIIADVRVYVTDGGAYVLDETQSQVIARVAAINNDATLSDVSIDGTTLPGFAPATTIYNVVLPSGTTVVPTVTASVNDTGGATAEITPAASLPGTTTILVTAADGITTEIYSINFTVVLPVTVTLESPTVEVGIIPLQITVPADVNNASLTTSPVDGVVTIPQVSVQAGTEQGDVTVQIMNDTEVTGPTDWDGTINLPQVVDPSSVTVTPESGNEASVSGAIEIGIADSTLTFSQPVRILLAGQGGKKAGWILNETFTPITYVMTSDTVEALGTNPDGYITVGSDLVIWTTHFTTFVAYTETSLTGYTLSGQVLVEGDDLTEGQIHYSGGVSIELKQGEEIKYSTISSEAEDLTTNGSFSLTGIAAGDYTVVISKAGYLTRSFDLTINSDLTLSTTSNQYLNRIYLLAGDIVSDEFNVIAASDVNYILSQFNSNSTQVGFDPQVDIVKDQYNVISAADVNLMLSNFNKNSTQYPADIIY